jgi:hypothetical protein
LASIHPNWQKDLARSLAACGPVGLSAASPKLVIPPSSYPAPQRLRFWPLYAVSAVVVIGFVVLGARDYRRMVSLSAPNLQATADIQHLEPSALPQSAPVAEFAAETWESGAPATAPRPQPTGNAQIASLVLDPGLTRGIGELKRLTVPQGTKIAKITLRLEETPDAAVREDLVTAEGQIKWSQEVRPSEPEKRAHRLLLLLPASLLTHNDYQIVLSRQSADGFERFATYTFRVIR